jgi:hypothetical protein
MKTSIVLACGVLLATGAALAQTRNNDNAASQTTNARSQANATTPHRATVAGVVTSVDQNGRQLAVVVPAGAEVDVARMGKSVLVERGVNLIALEAPINNSAQIFIDGKQSSISNLKEGDVVRAAFDPNQQQFLSVSAVTPDEMRNDFNKARTDLHMSNGASQEHGGNASHQHSGNAPTSGKNQ